MLACSYIFGIMLDKIALLENWATIKHFATKLAHVSGMTTKTMDNLCTLKNLSLSFRGLDMANSDQTTRAK